VRALCEPVLVGPANVVKGTGIPVVETAPCELRVGEIRPEHGRAALEAARTAIHGALAGDFHAVVAAPHSEAAIRAAGMEFDGYPTFVARCTGVAPEDAILVLCFEHGGREIRIAHVTLHAGVLHAVRSITKERVVRTIRAVHEVFPEARIAVSGVNPHALGAEEEGIIGPAIAAARAGKISVDGPIGADTLLQRDYDAYVVMLHDQGHVAAKALAPNRSAALTIGTPVLFSSVGHGAAFDIAGRDRADPAAMVEAITRLVTRRRRVR
jgi:4-hydroxy-L-threonine phosphate dehydrogenase PdxA